jgi:ribonuclease Y
VGFLCGLLAAELGVPVKDARRAGMLHDLGKAMDHSVDGGHAVIGADFIKQHGEADHIVHAVRAHHFDEQPNSDLAYLVIAADAISGARPGARRSTAASYTQKIQDLQTIASGFEGVTDTHVLSAGREIRVYVDGRKMDDLHSLQLSRDIAHKIENEMQYPGQIKVTVVRETQAIVIAK